MSKRPHTSKITGSSQGSKKPRFSPPPSLPQPIISLAPPPGLTVKNASEVLQRYSGWLRNRPPDTVSHSNQEVNVGGYTHYIATVHLPTNCNVRQRNVRSDQPYPEPLVAKRNAVFHAVCELYHVHEIDDGLMPTPKTPSKPGPPPSVTKELIQNQPVVNREISKHSPPTSRPSEDRVPPSHMPADTHNGRRESPYSTSSNNVPLREQPSKYVRPQEESRNVAREILGPKESSVEHEILTTSQFWSRNPPLGTKAYGAVISITFSKSQDIDGLCRRLCLVTSRPLPFAKEIALDLVEYNNSNLRVLPHARLGPSAPLNMAERQLDHAFEWSRKFVRSLTNQKIDGLLEKAPYLFVPLRNEFVKPTCTEDDVAWDELNLWDSFARDLNLRDVDQLRRSLDDAVLSPNQEFARRHYAVRVRSDLTPNSPAPRKKDVSIHELTAGKNLRFPMQRLRYPDQPIVEAEHVNTAAKGGWAWTLNDIKPLHHVIPELLALYFLPASVVRTGTFIPSIMTALDEHLVAAECNEEVFAGKLDHLHVLRAITAPAVRPAPHNYERLEMLGDAVLHFVASVDVVRRAEPGEEGEADAGHELRTERHLIVSNRTLAMASENAGVVKYLRNSVFRRRDYCPPGWIYEEYGPPPQDCAMYKEVGGKIPSDLVESLLGAAYLSTGKSLQGALDAIHTLQIPVQLRSTYELQTASVVTRLLSEPSRLQNDSLTVLGYEFKDPTRGRFILCIPPRAANFEQCSFIGNAVLELLFVEQLWKHLHLSPHEMTQLKQKSVNMVALGALAVSTHVVDQMRVVGESKERLNAFIAEMRTAEGLASLQEHREYWTQVSEFKYLGSVFQAVIGAIAEDCSYHLPTLRQMYAKFIGSWMERFGPPLPSSNPKSRFQSFMDCKGCRQWNTVRAHQDLPGRRATDVTCHDHLIAHAEAPSIPEAVALASEKALQELLPRIDMLCNCGSALARID
ncbi:hypothetical protein CspHIS471_0400160 [Cutaneotrichosporon sp. HIS471]|nr:hypothetical protein CspHIS471_0400160 [Cutaneotrichosporon sp. HIS471]